MKTSTVAADEAASRGRNITRWMERSGQTRTEPGCSHF